MKKKVLLIGWDAADWKIINDLLDSGKMPALEALVNRGVIGNLATLDPPLSPMLWTSIATGMRADKHGILGFTEPVPDQGGIRPVNVTTRKVKALWNILHHEGYKSNVVSWWPSHPAEPLHGVMVSNLFYQAHQEYGKKWMIPKGSVYPSELTRKLSSYRIHPAELTEAHLLPFVPQAASINQEKDRGLAALAKITADAASVQAISTWLMEHTEWDFMAIYFDAIDHYCHSFMKYRPPKLDTITDEMFNLYKEVVDGAYIFHDMMLERLVQLAGEETTIMLISDHGFHSDQQRIVALPKFPAAPAYEHRPYGIICMAGPDMKQDERIYGASLLDITPTILSIYGLPVGKDMDGKVLVNAFEHIPPVSVIPSWELVDGDFGMHPAHKQEDPHQSFEALKQLVELGYIEDPGEDKNTAMQRTMNELDYNLSRVYLSSGQVDKAADLLEKLVKINDSDLRYNLDLANCYLHLRKFTEVKQIILKLRESDEKIKPNLDLLEGILMAFVNKPHAALALLKQAEESSPGLLGIHLELGKVYLNLRRYQDAEQAYLRVLQVDDSNAPAYHGHGLSLLRQGKYREAAEQILTAIGLIYFFPPAHYHLGEALFYLGKYPESAQAYEISLTMSPKFIKARRWLVRLYKDYVKNEAKKEYHEQILHTLMKGKITIVSGLPRSGTSMMMQILEAGGMEVLTDQSRQADTHNPNGYYEYEKVKKLTQDHSFLKEADGKAIKVIAHLLKFLPKEYDFRIIFMKRDMYEIIQSQQKMLGRSEDAFPVAIASAFENELLKVDVWQKKEPNVEMLYVNYKDIIKNPYDELHRVNDFLDFCLDEEEAIKRINEHLYRTKR